jgi:hypothetical protein
VSWHQFERTTTLQEVRPAPSPLAIPPNPCHHSHRQHHAKYDTHSHNGSDKLHVRWRCCNAVVAWGWCLRDRDCTPHGTCLGHLQQQQQNSSDGTVRDAASWRTCDLTRALCQVALLSNLQATTADGVSNCNPYHLHTFVHLYHT